MTVLLLRCMSLLLAHRVISLCRKTCRLLDQQRTKAGPDIDRLGRD
jgi:hypothetical protein